MNRYNFDKLSEDFTKELQSENIYDNLYHSINNLCRIFITILETDGKGWAEKLTEEGVFTKEEEIRFTNAFEPYIEPIIMFLKGSKDKMKGGAVISEENLSTIKQQQQDKRIKRQGKLGNEGEIQKFKDQAFADRDLKKNERIECLNKCIEDALAAKKAPGAEGAQTPGAEGAVPDGRECIKKCFEKTKTEGEKPTDLYTLFDFMLNKIDLVNTTVNNYASKYGILRLEKEHDFKEDVHLIPDPLKVLIASGLQTTGMPTNLTLKLLNKIKVPFRLIVVCIYLGIDVTRLAMNFIDYKKGREVMSIVMALFELLRGDWKQAILSLIGYYGNSPLLIGELLKTYVYLFEILDPSLQENIIRGSLKVGKSIIIGALLAITKVITPDGYRFPMMRSLYRKSQDPDTLSKTNGIPIKSYLKPSWNNIYNIQAVWSDPKFTCSKEFRDKTDGNTDFVSKIILQLLDLEVDPHTCTVKIVGDNKINTVKDNLKAKSLKFDKDYKITEGNYKNNYVAFYTFGENLQRMKNEIKKGATPAQEEEESPPPAYSPAYEQKNTNNKNP